MENSPKLETVPVESAPKPTLTEEQIIAAATNSPLLSPDEFTLGTTTFKIVQLPYDDYVIFLGYLQPFLEALAGKKNTSVSLPGIALLDAVDSSTLLKFCSKNLPEMARLVCKQSVPDITAEELKKLAGNPFALASVVLKQVAKNGMIRDFATFFKQVTPLLKAVR